MHDYGNELYAVLSLLSMFVLLTNYIVDCLHTKSIVVNAQPRTQALLNRQKYGLIQAY